MLARSYQNDDQSAFQRENEKFNIFHTRLVEFRAKIHFIEKLRAEQKIGYQLQENQQRADDITSAVRYSNLREKIARMVYWLCSREVMNVEDIL